jgi:hypothetical protein
MYWIEESFLSFIDHWDKEKSSGQSQTDLVQYLSNRKLVQNLSLTSGQAELGVHFFKKTT